MDPELEKLIPGFGLIGGKSEGSTTLPVTEVTTEAKDTDVEGSSSTETTEEVNQEVESEENETEVKPKTKAKVTPEESDTEEEESNSEEERTDDFAEDDELDRRLGKKETKAKDKTKPGEDNNDKVQDKSKPLLPNKPVVIPRDLEGFDDDEKVLLTKMSNDAFNRFAPIIKEAKTFKQEKERLTQEIEIAKKTIPAKSYFNKLGYIEDEEFVTNRQQADTSSAYARFYKEQRINMLTTGKCYNLAGLDQDGNPVPGQIVEARDEGEKIKYAEGIQDIINQQLLVAQTTTSKLEQIRSNWESKSQNAVSMLAAKEKQFFPQYAAQGEKNEFVKAMAETLREEGFGENPLKNMMCYLYAGLMDAVKELNKQKAAQTKATTAEQIAKNAGPVTRTVAGTKPNANRNGSGKVTAMATDEEFDDRLRGR